MYASNCYRLVDLSLPLTNGGGFSSPAQITFVDHFERVKTLSEMYRLPQASFGGMGNASERFTSLSSHAGTHLDAPWHYGPTSGGERAMTVDEIPLAWCCGDGVCLDLSHKKPGEDIMRLDTQRALEAIGVTIKPLDIVLIRTGVSSFYGQPGCEEMNPGMTREATLFLAEHGVRLAGIDAGMWDRPVSIQIAELQQGRYPGRYMEGHRAAGEKGMCIMEWLTNLDQLPPFGFKVYAFPVKVQGGSAGWVRAVAICAGQQSL